MMGVGLALGVLRHFAEGIWNLIGVCCGCDVCDRFWQPPPRCRWPVPLAGPVVNEDGGDGGGDGERTATVRMIVILTLILIPMLVMGKGVRMVVAVMVMVVIVVVVASSICQLQRGCYCRFAAGFWRQTSSGTASVTADSIKLAKSGCTSSFQLTITCRWCSKSALIQQLLIRQKN